MKNKRSIRSKVLGIYVLLPMKLNSDVLPDEDEVAEYLRTRAVDSFEDALEFYDLRTMEVVNEAVADDYCKRFASHIGRSMRNICELKISYKRNTDGIATLKESEKLTIFWEALQQKLQDLTNTLIDQYLTPVGILETTVEVLTLQWTRLHTSYNRFIRRVSPLLEYFVINYPSITKEVTKELTIYDFSQILLIDLLKKKLGGSFVPFLEAFLSNYRTKETLDNTDLEKPMPLALMYRYKIYVDDYSNSSAKDFYLENVYKYAQREIAIPVTNLYFRHLIKILARNALISGTISAMLIQDSTDIILYHTLMVEDRTFELIVCLKDQIKVGKAHSDSSAITGYFTSLKVAYESRSMLRKFDTIYRQVIRLTLDKASNIGLETPILEACKLVQVSRECEDINKTALEEVSRVFKGPFNIMERYLRICEVAIRRFNHRGISTPELTSKLRFDETLILHVPMILQISSTFLDLYRRSMFRRFIIHGLSTINGLTNPSGLEFRLLSLFKEIYGSTPEYHNLENLKNELLQSSHLARRFEQEEPTVAKVMTPLIFQKKSVPSVFQENVIENLVISSEMQHYWSQFLLFHRALDNKADFKKLHLVDYLQHCEVETPFSMKNGKPLILDLTLYQTCVLSLYNDVTSLTAAEIARRLQLPDLQLNEVLRSFVDVGLLTPHEDSYILNDEFSPDEGRIKNGKLRVAMTSAGRSTRHDISASGPHMEGHSSYWKQELTRACIVRSLKGVEKGLSFDTLFATVETQLHGISMGEFKDALRKTVDDNLITLWKNCYKYR